MGSRGNTPSAGGRNRSDDDDDDNKAGNVRKKVLKKNLKKGDKHSRPSNGKSSNGSAKKPHRLDFKNEKRERDDQDDDDDDGTPLRKRMKLQRVGSTASLQTSIAGEESIDGSFVDDNESGDD